MHYLKIKEKIQYILPKGLFNFLISLRRNTHIRAYKIRRKYKLQKFRTTHFKYFSIYGIDFRLKLDPSNGYVDEELFLYGVYEKDIFHLMKKEIQSGDTFVDIGANIGMYTNFIPKIVGDAGRVIAFEPIQRIYKQNLASTRKNNYQNVELHNLACSDTSGETMIYLSSSNIGRSSIEHQQEGSSEKIHTITGDEMLLEKGKVDFIKIDTEGHERHVLQGLKNTIKKDKPKTIIEFSPSMYRGNQGQLILDFFLMY